jgi:hypothetical protein
MTEEALALARARGVTLPRATWGTGEAVGECWEDAGMLSSVLLVAQAVAWDE